MGAKVRAGTFYSPQAMSAVKCSGPAWTDDIIEEPDSLRNALSADYLAARKGTEVCLTGMITEHAF